jgi:succinate dehydrogenase / fumarate reductase, membrane anchor subunit
MEFTGSAPKSGENVGLWLLKIITGALVIVLIFVHLIVNHFTAQNGLLSYHDVAVYLSNPWIALMEGTFLVVVVSHALLGLRSILLDLKPSRSILGAINWVFSIVGVVAVIYGIWLIRTIVSRGVGG